MIDRPALDRHHRRSPVLVVGTVVWLGSELMFFSGLFAAWFTLRASASEWPPQHVELETGLAALFTVVLVVSSVTMQLGVRGIERDDRTSLQRWTWVTIVLGIAFLANQGREFASLNFGLSSHAYGSAYYLLVGFHAIHVLGGVVMMLLLLGRSTAPGFGRADTPAVEMVSYYWHFVDVVWLGVFAVIFILS